MSLDKNLFTLTLTPTTDPGVVDLIDPSGIVHYRKRRIPGPSYKVEVYDPLAESLLITASAPSATSKIKTLELCNPTLVVELKYTGTISFRWGFKWEEHEFEWKREECYMIRKPDPPVLVAITKEPPGRIKTSCVQILDYNLNRFDIDDRKGLEIVILTALLTFQDSSDIQHLREDSTPTPTTPGGGIVEGITRKISSHPTPPPPPPKPEPKVGVDRIAEMQAIRGEVNEVTVEDEGDIDSYAEYCWNLLQDEAMLFMTIRSASAEFVPKVLQVVHQTKRLRHKAGLDDELYQYVTYDTAEQRKGPRRINLDDDDSKGKYTPPKSLTVHLSKIPMPELQPKASASDKPTKDTKKDDKSKKKDDKSKKKDERKEGNQPSSSHHVHSNQLHPYQPTPSPAQLNNPGLYVAPPPRRPNSPYAPRPMNAQVPPPPPPPPPGSVPPPSIDSGLPTAIQAILGGQTPQSIVTGIFDKFSSSRPKR